MVVTSWLCFNFALWLFLELQFMQLQGWGCEGAVTHPTVFSDSNLVFPQFRINMTSSQEEPHFSLCYSIQFTLIIRCFADHMIEGLQFWIISRLRYFLFFPSIWQIAEGCSFVGLDNARNGIGKCETASPQQEHCLMIKGRAILIAWALSAAYAKRPKLDKTDHLIGQ